MDSLLQKLESDLQTSYHFEKSYREKLEETKAWIPESYEYEMKHFKEGYWAAAINKELDYQRLLEGYIKTAKESVKRESRPFSVAL